MNASCVQTKETDREPESRIALASTTEPLLQYSTTPQQVMRR